MGRLRTIRCRRNATNMRNASAATPLDVPPDQPTEQTALLPIAPAACDLTSQVLGTLLTLVTNMGRGGD